MSDAKMCDRCGEFYMVGGGCLKEKHEEGVFRYKREYDICSSCLSEFNEWIDSAKAVDE